MSEASPDEVGELKAKVAELERRLALLEIVHLKAAPNPSPLFPTFHDVIPLPAYPAGPGYPLTPAPAPYYPANPMPTYPAFTPTPAYEPMRTPVNPFDTPVFPPFTITCGLPPADD